MEAHELISRTAVASVPVEVDYALTSFAVSLWPLLVEMQYWAVEHAVQLQRTALTD